jgi:hypothetical protein
MSKPNQKTSPPAPVATNNIDPPADAVTNPPSPPDESSAVLSNEPPAVDQAASPTGQDGAPPPKGQDDVPAFEVLSPLDHNGKRYEIGSTVAMTAEQAALIPHVLKAL